MNNVLIIDDDKELCALMKKCVEQENLSALVAHGGVEGLRLTNENKRNCSLVILDMTYLLVKSSVALNFTWTGTRSAGF